MTWQSLKLGKFMTDQVANMLGHVQYPSIISTPANSFSLQKLTKNLAK